MQPTGLNPFFAQQQVQQQSAFLQSPTAYPTSPFSNTASVPPINIPLQSQATGYFNPSPQSATYLSPSPSAPFLQQAGTSPFSAAYGPGPSTSPFQNVQYPQPSSSPFQQMQPTGYAGTPAYPQPASPYGQMSSSPFAQPQLQQQQQQQNGQGNLGAFASGMMPRQSTNPFQR